MVTHCFWLLRKILDFTSSNIRDPVLFSDSSKQDMSLYEDDNQLPSRRTDINFSTYSAVVGKDLICRSDSRFEVWGTKGYNLHVRGRNRRLPGYPVIDMDRGLNSTVDISKLRRAKVVQKRGGDSSGNKYLSLLYGNEVIKDKVIGIFSSIFEALLLSCIVVSLHLFFTRKGNIYVSPFPTAA